MREQTFDNSPVSQFLFMELVVVDARCGDFVSLLVFSLLARSICPRTSSHDERFEKVLVLVDNLTVCLSFSLDASQVHLIKKRRLLQINVLHHFLPHGTPDSLSSQPS